MSDLRETRAEQAVIERLHKLRVVLPVMAHETATARREAARLRAENFRLSRRLEELETAFASGFAHRRAPIDA
jgi:hypothetical protein